MDVCISVFAYDIIWHSNRDLFGCAVKKGYLSTRGKKVSGLMKESMPLNFG
jgi:hypothetical protein